MKTIAFFLATLVPAIASAQETPTVGYAPVNGLKMYYEVHGSGDPVVLLHGAFMTIPGNWTGWIGELSKTRKVIAVEMQGHGRTADIKRDEQLRKPRRRCGGAARSPQNPKRGRDRLQHGRRRRDGVCDPPSGKSAQGRQHFGRVPPRRLGQGSRRSHSPKLTAEAFKGSPIEAEYKKLSPTPDAFPEFVKHVIASASKRPTTLAPTSSRPPRLRYSSSMAMPTACGSNTSRKCSA